MPYLPLDSGPERQYSAAPKHNSKPVAMAPSWSLPATQHQTSQFLEYWQVIRGNFVLICILAMVGAGLGWLVATLRPSMYQARTVLDIRSLNEDFLNQNGTTPIGTSGTVLPESYLQTELKILDSESVRRLALDQLVKQRQGAGANKAEATPAWRAWLGILDPSEIPIKELIADAGGRVKVRALGNTRIVDMLCDARDAQLAADVCNSIVRTYIQYNIESRSANTKETSDWLASQLDDVKRRLTKAESELQESTRGSSLIPNSETENLAQEKLRQLQGALAQAQAVRINKESQYQVAASTPADSLPLALDAGPIRDYRLRLTELRRQVAELSVTMTPAHYKVRELTDQMAEIESALKKEQSTLITRLRGDFETAERQESLLQTAYDNQTRVVSQRGDKEVHYDMLRREVDSERKLYDTLLQKVQEVGLSAAMRASTISVVDVARPPGAPYSPSMIVSLGVGFFGGSCLGLALSFLRLQSDRTLQNPGDAAFHLQLRELGVIPSVPAQSLRLLLSRTRRIPAANPPISLKAAPDPESAEDKVPAVIRRHPSNSIALGTWLQNPPELAEAFCSTMNSLLFASGDRARVIVLTSPGAGDGKTTAATNLAAALAKIGRRVVMVDGDLRKPRLSSIFNIDCEGGLAKLLDQSEMFDEQLLAEQIHKTQIDNLFVLPTSVAHKDVSSKLHSERMRFLLRWLRREFDVVIIDSPPMLSLSDARVLGWLADGVLLVFRSRKTTRESALAAADCLMQDGIQVLGTILNDWNPRKGARYGVYPSSYMGVA